MAVGKIDDKIKLRALNILSSYLTGTNQSPFQERYSIRVLPRT